MTSRNGLEKLLTRYGISPESDSALSLSAYLLLLEKWNRKINLVSSTAWEILGPLFEESIWAAGQYTKNRVEHVDVGSGSGFPALPMRILNPHMNLELVESRTKRAVFLETVCEMLRIENASVSNCTLSSYLQSRCRPANWDCISWKAIKLAREDFSSLIHAAKEGVRFWIFHGKDIPVRGGLLTEDLKLVKKEGVPGKPASYLSIYQKRATRGAS